MDRSTHDCRRRALLVAALCASALAALPRIAAGLARARDFDVGTAVFGRAMSARELRQALGLGR